MAKKRTCSCGTNAENPKRARWTRLACLGSQLERRIRFILPARGFSHILKLLNIDAKGTQPRGVRTLRLE